MRNTEIICPKTGKHRYPSEAAATRAMNRYDDIKRVYKCKHCENSEGFQGWHTTHMGTEEMDEIGFNYFKRDFYKEGYPMKYIKNRIKTLKKRIYEE